VLKPEGTSIPSSSLFSFYWKYHKIIPIGPKVNQVFRKTPTPPNSAKRNDKKPVEKHSSSPSSNPSPQIPVKKFITPLPIKKGVGFFFVFFLFDLIF
jgi:hypothetical protein